MTIRRLAKGLLIIAAALLGIILLIVVAMLVIDALPGSMIYIPELDSDVRRLRARIRRIEDVERIDVFFSRREWIDMKNPENKADDMKPVAVITEPHEIRQIVEGFRHAQRFAPYWTQCGFYIRLDCHSANGEAQTLLVGIDDCKTFTTPDTHAVGHMANHYFYEHYVQPLRENYLFKESDTQ